MVIGFYYFRRLTEYVITDTCQRSYSAPSRTFYRSSCILAGDRDELAATLEAASVRVITNQYHHWQRLQPLMGDMALFAATTLAEFIQPCDTFIFGKKTSKKPVSNSMTSVLTSLRVAKFLSLAKTVVVLKAPNPLWKGSLAYKN